VRTCKGDKSELQNLLDDANSDFSKIEPAACKS